MNLPAESNTALLDATDADKQVTTIIYVLYAASILVGVTCLVAIVMNYVKKDEVAGTFLESHFRWQIRTFWFAMLWSVIGVALLFVFVGFFVLGANFLWFIYRVVKGWIRLNEGKAMYEQAA